MGVGKDWVSWWCAAQNGHDKIVQLLLDHGAGIDDKSGNSNTPLMEASRYGRVLTVKLLIKQGADVNERNGRGETALDCVGVGKFCCKKDKKIIQKILKDFAKS